MKTIFLSLLLLSCTLVSAQVKFEALEFSPQFPKRGDKVTFSFTKSYSPLINDTEIQIAVYQFDKNSGYKITEPTLKHDKANIYSGTFTVNEKTAVIAFGISGNKEKDNNKGAGYTIPVYDNNRKPVPDYYQSGSALYEGYGEYVGISRSSEKALKILEEGMKLHPQLKNDDKFYYSYLSSINGVHKTAAKPFIIDKLDALASKNNLSEKEYGLLSNWYNRLKMKSTADSFLAIRKTKYPDGSWKKEELYAEFNKEKSADKKNQLYETYINRYGSKGDDSLQVNLMRSRIVNAYANEKNFPAMWEWGNKLSPQARASLYNDISWNLAEKNDHMEEARKMSYEATMWAKKQMTSPQSARPETMTKKQWEQNRRQIYGMYADTYGFILHQEGNYAEALPYAKDGAEINNLKNAEYNERYALLLEKAADPDEAKKIIAQFVEDGVATAKTKEVLKSIYLKEGGSETDFAGYLSKLEMAAKTRKAEELAKTMINEKTPAFSLKDFEGNEVSLKSLEGKIVIVDFWATWCGPCIASMPGMKAAQDKFKERDDVVFLFVNTWESAEDKKKNAKDFITKTNYPFRVLMDEEDKMVSDFQVRGIPTKFVIDKLGQTKFKSIGYSGNNDDLVDEIMLMVDLASK